MKLVCFAQRRKALLIWTVVCSTLAILMIFPTECRNGGTNGTYLCIQVLIPSMFPFMFITNFVVCSGLIYHTPKIISAPTKALFGLPAVCGLVVLLSAIGGYPTGAAGTASLYKNGLISKADAKRMALFCVASGPGFLVTYTGSVMLGSVKSGYILLASQAVAFIITGILARFAVKEQEAHSEQSKDIKSQKILFGCGIATSVTQTIKSCAYMCGFVVLFGVFCEVFITITSAQPYLRKLTPLIEITNGIKILAEDSSLVMISFACGFAGLCVHFQIFQQLMGIGVNKTLFYIFRILQGIICAAATAILIRLFPQSCAVFSTVTNASTTVYSSGIGCVFLILSCVIFLFTLRNTNKETSYNRR